MWAPLPKIALKYHTVKISIDFSQFYDPTNQSHVDMIVRHYNGMKSFSSNCAIRSYEEKIIDAFGDDFLKQIIDAVEKNHIQHSVVLPSNDCIQIHVTI